MLLTWNNNQANNRRWDPVNKDRELVPPINQEEEANSRILCNTRMYWVKRSLHRIFCSIDIRLQRLLNFCYRQQDQLRHLLKNADSYIMIIIKILNSRKRKPSSGTDLLQKPETNEATQSISSNKQANSEQNTTCNKRKS